MQIIAHDDSRLVIHQGPWPLRLMGLVFGAAGAGILAFILSGHLGEHNAWVAVVVGAVFALAGLAMLLGASDMRCTFDRGTRNVTLRRRGLFGSFTHIYAWSDIEDVALEQARATGGRGSSSPTWRVVLLLTGGARVPWTTVYTSDERSQEACVAAARAFGGWHQLAGEEGKAHDVAVRGAAANARAARYLAAPVLAIFVAVGLFMNWQQWRRYEMWRPTRAVITRTDVVVVHGNKGDSYRPVVAYRYADGAGSHDAAGATILSISSSWSWASGITSRYRVGDSVTAYIDPQRADRGFVVRRLSWLPLVFVVVPLVMSLFLFRMGASRVRGLPLPGRAQVPIVAA